MLYINSFCIMYSICICSWWWDVHTCIYSGRKRNVYTMKFKKKKMHE